MQAWIAACLCVLLAGATQAQQLVAVPSLERSVGDSLLLKAHWFAAGDASTAAPAPAIVLLHGCGGAYGRNAEVSARFQDYVGRFNAEGWHVLVLDSFTARGRREICTEKIGKRSITMANRRLDALGALQWLAARSDVNADRLALVGWSNGGSTVLAATNRRHAEVAAAPPLTHAAVAFYPGCEAELQRGYEPSAPLLMLVGEADDWTAAAPCVQLAARSAEPRPAIEVYPGAYHGFDSAAPLRHRGDVPGGVKPGQGVTVGGNPQAWLRSREALLAFLRPRLAAPRAER